MISSDAPRRARLDTLAGSGGFRPAVRFGGPPQPPDPRERDLAERQRIESDAFARGFEEGRKSAMAEAEENAAREDAARERLGAQLLTIGSEDEQRLSQRLRDIALALCSETLAPIALDEAALNRRIAACLAMLREAEERVVHLHPDDIDFIDPELAETLTIRADPALERGEVRVESADGGVEDGPSTWRKAIAEALKPC